MTGQSIEDLCGEPINKVEGKEIERGDGALRMWGGCEQTNEK